MIAAKHVALILLAGGTSTRFGPRDKLAEPLHGLPLGLHAARMLATLPFATHIVVTRRAGPDFAASGFTPVTNPDPGTGQSGSIRLGLAQALSAAPQAILIALADMPFVTTPHIEALLARLDAAHPVVASTNGQQPAPPALFGSAFFPTLAALSGDAGARTLLGRATLIAAPAAELADIDTPDDWPSDLS